MNDNPPYFTNVTKSHPTSTYNSIYEIKIPENISPGTIFYTIIAVDNDLYGKGSSKTGLQYKIIHGNEDGKFSLDAEKGDLGTTTFLDREKQSFYTFLIEVNDGLHYATCNVTIELLDGKLIKNKKFLKTNFSFFLFFFFSFIFLFNSVNDNAPIFDRTDYYAIIDDNPGNTTITTARATDLDGDEILYSINSSNSDFMYFQINPKSGEITTQSSSLAFIKDHSLKTSNLLSFDVLAIEVGKQYEAHTSKATVHVTVINNQNNVMPKLKGYPYVIHVNGYKDEFRVGNEIGNIQLIESTGLKSDNNYIFRIITNGDGNSFIDYFYVNSQNGKILVKRPLNSNYYQAFIEVTKATNPTISTRSLVQIFIGKIDERKIISNYNFKVDIEENSPIGTEVINLASKSKSTINQKYLYEIAYASGNIHYFNLSQQTGRITLAQSMDYEKDPSNIELVVLAKKSHNSNDAIYFNVSISLINGKKFHFFILILF